MPSREAEEAKTEGSTAYTKGNYSAAIDHYSRAIELGGDDRSFLKIIYSNRSAAYCKLGKFEDAVKDGNKCVELDGQWAKGYARKGDALYALKRYTDAYNAYNAGLRTTGDTSLGEKVEQAMQAIRNEANRSSSASGAGAGGELSTIHRYLHLAIIFLAVVYLIPFLPYAISGLAYRLSAALFGGLHVANLFRRYGFPKFESSYYMLLMQDPSINLIFLGFMLTFSPRPYVFCILPILLLESRIFLKEIFAFALANAATIEQQALPWLARLNPQLAQIRVSQIFASNHLNKGDLALQRLAATCEVYQGVFHVVEVFLPSRNIIQLYLWWQYLKLRYMTDSQGHVKAAFQDLDRSLSQLMASQYCPTIVRKVYDMVKGFLAKQVQMPDARANAANAGGGGLLSKCSIM
eukprot:gene147-154_t